MKLFLATPKTLSGEGEFLKTVASNNKLYILDSYYYISDFVTNLIPLFSDFLLDSGAFTFIEAEKKKKLSIEVNYKNYVNEYISYIVKNKIKNYFEFDIDNVIGYKKVLEIRKELELSTKQKCIPVFHKERGLKEYEKICEEYNYIAIGTMTDYKRNFNVLIKLLQIAQKYNTKVHGLGYTSMVNLQKTSFYSVDSTSWNCGNRFGIVYRFNGNNIDFIHKPKGKRLKAKEVLKNNFLQWVKFGEYLDKKIVGGV